MKESSIVRENLMNEENYSPYCGCYDCSEGMGRTKWSEAKEQFYCGCGWVSAFPKDFISRYKDKWGKYSGL